jgi:hypothetical protein
MSNPTVFVIPMAGASSRFFEAGFTRPKFMLPAFRQTVFHFALGSFEKYFKTNPFIFITGNDPEADAFVRREVENMGVAQAQFVQMDQLTGGQAETVALGLQACDIAGETPITIFNIDSFRPGFTLPDDPELTGADGYLEVFEGAGDHWSFARVEGTKVVETAEKKRISSHCSNGLYHFNRAEDFTKAFNDARQSGEKGEYYIAPLYNRLIAAGKDIRIRQLAPEDTKFCGLPTEYRDFLLSGATEAWDAENIPDAPPIEGLSMRDFHQAKAAGDKERVVWVLRQLGTGKPLATRHLNDALRYLEILGRTEDVDALITLALGAAKGNIEDTMIVAEATFMTGRQPQTLEICDAQKEKFPNHSFVLYWGVRALDAANRGDEVSTYIKGNKFFNLPEHHLETLSFVLADNGFTRKTRIILQLNWARRPGPAILHALMKLAAREGHGRSRMRLVESAITQGVEPRIVDKMHAAAIALRSGAQDTLDIIDPHRELPLKAFPSPNIMPLKPKVALCLSGQMRAFERTSPTIIKHVVERFNADVFISTWNNRGITASAMRNFSRILPAPVASALSSRHSHWRFAERFPALTTLIDDFEKAPITQEAIAEFYTPVSLRIIDEEAFEDRYFTPGAMEVISHKKTLKNQLKMYYQLHACNRLKMAQEAEMGARYDMVIRMRPDLMLTGPAVPETETFGFDMYSDVVRGIGCGDQICTSSSANMDLMSTVWDRAKQVISRKPDLVYDNGGLGIGVHGFIAQTLWSHGLAPRQYEKPLGTTIADNPLYFPDTAQAMLRDMATWSMLDDDDINCIAVIFNTLNSNETWSNHIPALLALAQATLPEMAMQKVTV